MSPGHESRGRDGHRPPGGGGTQVKSCIIVRVHNLRRFSLILLGAWLVALAVIACSDLGDPVDPVPPEPVSLSADIQPIFNARCAVSGCHVQPAPQGGCDLSEGQSYANIVSVRSQTFPGERVTPGSPAGSVLYVLVEGGSMPQLGGPLPSSQIELIRRWIAEGALDN